MVNFSGNFTRVLFLTIVSLAVSVPTILHAQQQRAYQVLSIKPDEVVVRITPTYETHSVKDYSTGKTYAEMTFAGGSVMDSSGAPQMPRIVLPFLAPDKEQAAIEIVSQSLEVLPNVDLAPVPSYPKVNGEYTKQYSIDPDRYYSSVSAPLFTSEPVGRFRTAFAENVVVAPVQYDAASRSVTRVRSLTLRIRFPHASGMTAQYDPSVSASEADMYRSMFINGSVTSFYTLSMPAIGSSAKVRTNAAMKATSSTGTWLQIETTEEGVYHITAQDLVTAGVSGSIDASSVQLFGVGGELLDENLTDSSGEWIQRPIDVRANGSSFSELYFYAPGTTVWRYTPMRGSTDGLYHRQNPYTSTGHYLLRIGGDAIGSQLTVPSIPDTIRAALGAPTNRVFNAVVHEVDHFMESGNVGREMVDQGIPRDDVGPISFDVPVPGYTSDSTTIRVGYDASIQSNQDSQNSGHVSVAVNGQLIGTINANTDSDGNLQRDWDNALRVGSSISSPISVGLTFSCTSVTASAMFDFVELMYKRTTDLASGSIPFMLIDRNDAEQINFNNASGGAVWDVTASSHPRIVASATGGSMTAPLQAVPNILRRFVAFTSRSALVPHISTLPAPPSMRDNVCRTGATEILITPEAFLTQANELKTMREKGGQATEPVSVAVVNIEDIYREFGYGSRDVTAIRDFMSYTFRHAASRPLYLLLLGGGHCDYQNHQTSIPNFIPQWENPESSYPGSFRSTVPTEYPDDSYFGKLQVSADNSGRAIDVAVGRVSATSADTAEGFVQKVIHYETASDPGAWRTTASFVADDHVYDHPEPDPLQHLYETEGEVLQVPDRYIINKIYESSYPTVQTSLGLQKPACAKAIISAVNDGSVILSFIGHGNPSVWTHESVLTVPATINKFNNFDRLAYVTTATCDFSVCDNFAELSGGVQFLIKPDGGAIGLLGTSREVTEETELTEAFYNTLLDVDPAMGYGTSSVGAAFLAGKKACVSGNMPFFYLLGDPAQRLLVPKLTVNFDSINGRPDTGATQMMSALSEVRVSGSVARGGASAPADPSFNGNVTVTLYDTRTKTIATTIFPHDTILDRYVVQGPILFRGTARVTNGHFSVNFIVPKDVKLDSAAATLTGYAYADDNRSAAGVTRSMQLIGSDSLLAVVDTSGPTLAIFIGNRAFQSGDAVSMHSTVIADVGDMHGLNTSTASVGHSFLAWVDDSQDSAVDLATTFVAKQDDYTSGTSQHPIELPAGHHTLHVRAFDTFDNPSFGSVEFVAKKGNPYQLYDVSSSPNPLFDHTIFSFVQPGQSGSLVHVTLTLYTTSGQRVRTLTSETRQNSVELAWDGRDDAGNTVANAVYMFTVDAHDLDDGTSSQANGKCIVAR